MRPARSLAALAPLAPFALVVAVVLAACGQDDDPEGARVLWEKVNAAPGFRSWQRSPGFATRKPSFTAHGTSVELFMNKEMYAPLVTPGKAPVTEWPLGSIVVKEGFRGDTRSIVAIMEKRADGWFWAEYNGSGDTLFSGRPSVCIDCHDNRKTYSDWVYSFELPR